MFQNVSVIFYCKINFFLMTFLLKIYKNIKQSVENTISTNPPTNLSKRTSFELLRILVFKPLKFLPDTKITQ